jgi:hypothetical protein
MTNPSSATEFEEVLKNGLLLRTPRGDDEHIKLWIAGKTIHYRLLHKLTPKPRGKSGDADEFSFEQGDIVSIHLSDIMDVTRGSKDAGIAPANRGLLLTLTTKVGPVELLAEMVEEREVLARGFTRLVSDAQESQRAKGMADDGPGYPPSNGVRLACWKFIHYRSSISMISEQYVFDLFILGCILLNCVIMAMTDPTVPSADQPKVYDSISFILMFIFAGEAVIKLIALMPFETDIEGKKTGYFQDPWNRLDFFIVVVGFLQYVPNVGNFTMFRTFRVFRPLRTLGKVPGMKAIINTMLEAFDPLMNVTLLTIFIFFVFSVLGMELFQGQGGYRCLDMTNYDSTKPESFVVMPLDLLNPDTGKIFTGIEDRHCGGDFECPAPYTCMAVGRTRASSPGQAIIKHQNMNNGITGYDNIGQAFLTVFVAVTLEGWVDVMYLYQDTYNWWASTIFHVMMVLLGAFFCMNLALAVIAGTFENQPDDEGEEEEDDDEDKTPDEIRIAKFGDYPESPIPKFFYTITVAKWFDIFIMILIVLNTVTLAMEHTREGCIKYAADGITCELTGAIEMKESTSNFLKVTNYFFVVAFAGEMVIKLLGLGTLYFKDTFNLFDGFIVIVSFVEVAVKVKGMTALRMFRLARIFKMARNWASLRNIIESLFRTLPKIGSMLCLLLIFMFIASVAGMQLLGNPAEGGIPVDDEGRARFTDFWISMLTIFQFLTGENWNEGMYAGIISSGSYWIVIYYVIVIITGIFIVLNLFLAILLADFDAGDPPDFSLNGILSLCGVSLGSEPKEEALPVTVGEGYSEAQLAAMNNKPDDANRDRARSRTRDDSLARRSVLIEGGAHGAAEIVAIREDERKAAKSQKETEKKTLLGNACGFLGPDNGFRKNCNFIARNDYFEGFILFCIIASSILLVVDGPSVDKSSEKAKKIWKVLDGVDVTFVVIFTVEMVLKMCAFGIYSESEQTYFKNPWNILDFFLVVFALIGYLPGTGKINIFRTFRSLRALRPLRTIQRAPGLKIVVDVCFLCAPTFINICFVVFFFFLCFAILGVQFFAGKFWSCSADTKADGSPVVLATDCVGTDADGEAMEWYNHKMNFDNVGVALLTLYEVAGLEMWLDVMHDAMDQGSELGTQPIQEQNYWACVYFVLFIIIGVFLVLNLFVGAVVDKFNELKADANGINPLLTPEQQEYTAAMSNMIKTRPIVKPMPPRRVNPWGGKGVWSFRMKLYNMTMWDVTGRNMGTSFDMMISALIFGNVVCMGLSFWKRIPMNEVYYATGSRTDKLLEMQYTPYEQMLTVINDIFTWLFFFEMLLKMGAWGIRQYAQDYWNYLDAILAIASMIGFIVERILSSQFPLNAAIFRIIRLARLTRALRALRLMKRIQGIAGLIDTLMLTLPSMANVASLVFLAIFIFTALGMAFYGEIDTKQEWVNGMYNDQVNFEQFHKGFMLLFRCSTGESWNGIMHDIMISFPRAWTFFVAYQIFVSALLFELLTAIVLDEFGDQDDSDEVTVPPSFVSNFTDTWVHYDPDADKLIPLHSMTKLLCELDPPVFEDKKEATIALSKMNIATVGEAPHLEVHYVDALTAIIKYLFVKKYAGKVDGVEDALDCTFAEAPQVTSNIVNAFPDMKQKLNVDNDSSQPVGNFAEHFAAVMLQNQHKAKKGRKKAVDQRKKLVVELVELRNGNARGTENMTTHEIQEAIREEKKEQGLS